MTQRTRTVLMLLAISAVLLVGVLLQGVFGLTCFGTGFAAGWITHRRCRRRLNAGAS